MRTPGPRDWTSIVMYEMAPNMSPNPNPAEKAYPDRLYLDFGCLATIFNPLSARLIRRYKNQRKSSCRRTVYMMVEVKVSRLSDAMNHIAEARSRDISQKKALDTKRITSCALGAM